MQTLKIPQRRFRGLDLRQDRSALANNWLTDAKNRILEGGVLKVRKGASRWGTLDFSAIAGTRRSHLAIDVGAADHILFHIGTKIYYGAKTDINPTAVQNLSASDLAVTDAESSFQPWGIAVGSSGELVIKALFRQAGQCFTLEYDGSSWKGRNTGISNSGLTFDSQALSSGGSNQQVGSFRMRIVAQRIVGGVLVNESAPASEGTATGIALGYQQLTLSASTERIEVTMAHTSPDDQITHYEVQITNALDFSASSDFSSNGNDPTIYYRSGSIAKATALGGPVVIDVSAEGNFLETVPNLIGYDTIPGHLISHVESDLVFFGGIAPYTSRIYTAGLDGYFYHNELYNPYEFITASEGDGQQLIGLGSVLDGLVIIKEGKTGILPGHDPESRIIWRDMRLGALNRKAFANTSEDEMVILNQDGRIRVFDGVRYSRRKKIGENQNDFSDAVRSLTESIDPATTEFVFHEERLHVIYGEAGSRKALVLHPRENFDWTNWEDLSHEFNALVNNGTTWIFYRSSDGYLYEQNPSGAVYTTEAGALVSWSTTFNVVTPSRSPDNIIRLERCSIEGDFDYIFNGLFKSNAGMIEAGPSNAFPDPELPEHSGIMWFNMVPVEGSGPVFGNFIELTIAGQGAATCRQNVWVVQEDESDTVGWSIVDYEGAQFLAPESAGVILHLKFNADSNTEQDYSGYDRDHLWSDGTGGSRTFTSSLAPGGGQSLAAGTDSEYADADYEGLDGLGTDGYFADRTWERIFQADSLASEQIICDGGDGTNRFQFKVNTDGSLEFDVYTVDSGDSVVLNRKFTTAAGVILAGSLYVVQFVLSNGGLNGQFYVGLKSGYAASKLTTAEAWV